MIQFFYVTKSQYETAKSQNALNSDYLYFIKDGKTLYKGTELIASGDNSSVAAELDALEALVSANATNIENQNTAFIAHVEITDAMQSEIDALQQNKLNSLEFDTFKTDSFNPLVTQVRNKADASALDNYSLKEDVYTKIEMNTQLAGKVDDADLDNYYTKTQTDEELNDKVDVTTLSDYYKKTETFSQTEINNKLTSKASNSTVEGIDSKVTTLIGADTNKSVRTIANEELAKQLIPEGADVSLDTLQEIAQWIQDHPEDAANMNQEITDLNTLVGPKVNLPQNYTNIIDYITKVKSALENSINAVDEKTSTNATDIAKKVDQTSFNTLEATVEANTDSTQTNAGNITALDNKIEQVKSSLSSYETKTDSDANLTEAKDYTDNLKNSLKEGAYVDIDSSLSTSSKNPIENQAVTNWLAENVKNYQLKESSHNLYLHSENVDTVASAPAGSDGTTSHINSIQAYDSSGQLNTYAFATEWDLISNIPTASTSHSGIVQLSSNTSSSSESLAATSKAVKAAYDLANKTNIDKGNETTPVYFVDGVPTPISYTIAKSVPADAKFTDTTYSEASDSKSGLMSAADKVKMNFTNIAYGTCSTAAATAAKTVTITGNTQWVLKAGSLISVYFSATNTAENPTLNVNGTGAKNIYYGASQITSSSLGYGGTADRMMNFIYDGTQYRFIGWGYDSNTTYTNVKLGQGYATCTTAAATAAKVGTLSSYTLATGGIVAVKFTYDVPANATLNINSKGAKNIYYRGAKITNGIIKAGDVATFIYSSQYHLISIDRWQNDISTLNEEIDSNANSIADIIDGTIKVDKAANADLATNATNANHAETANSAETATTAATATTAGSATKATQDGNGNVISSTYATKDENNTNLEIAKTHSNTNLATAKTYSNANLKTAKEYTDNLIETTVASTYATKTELNGVSSSVATNTENISKLQSDVETNTENISNRATISEVNTIIKEVYGSGSHGSIPAISRIDTLDEQITTLINTDTGKSVRTIANEELAKQLIPDDAIDALNTLQEIAQWIQDHPDDASAMNTKITALVNEVYDVTNGTIPSGNSRIDTLTSKMTIAEGNITDIKSDISNLESNSATKAQINNLLKEIYGPNTSYSHDTIPSDASNATSRIDENYTSISNLTTTVTGENGITSQIGEIKTTLIKKAEQDDLQTERDRITGVINELYGVDNGTPGAKSRLDTVVDQADTNAENIADNLGKININTGNININAAAITANAQAITNLDEKFIDYLTWKTSM